MNAILSQSFQSITMMWFYTINSYSFLASILRHSGGFQHRFRILVECVGSDEFDIGGDVSYICSRALPPCTMYTTYYIDIVLYAQQQDCHVCEIPYICGKPSFLIQYLMTEFLFHRSCFLWIIPKAFQNLPLRKVFFEGLFPPHIYNQQSGSMKNYVLTQ